MEETTAALPSCALPACTEEALGVSRSLLRVNQKAEEQTQYPFQPQQFRIYLLYLLSFLLFGLRCKITFEQRVVFLKKKKKA